MAIASPFVYERWQQDFPQAMEQLEQMPAVREMMLDLVQTILDLQANLNSAEARIAALEP